jgi:hypothetical protein
MLWSSPLVHLFELSLSTLCCLRAMETPFTQQLAQLKLHTLSKLTVTCRPLYCSYFCQTFTNISHAIQHGRLLKQVTTFVLSGLVFGHYYVKLMLHHFCCQLQLTSSIVVRVFWCVYRGICYDVSALINDVLRTMQDS